MRRSLPLATSIDSAHPFRAYLAAFGSGAWSSGSSSEVQVARVETCP